MNKISKDLTVNEQIKHREVRVIDTDGKQIGIMDIQKALKLAKSKQLDLVQVAPKANPPVCRIMDYGKYKYEQSKKEKEAKKKQKVINVKELRMSPNIEEHDLQVRIKNARRFLKEGNKVKVTIRFRGREITHNSLGKEVLENLAESVRDLAVIEKKPKLEGRNMIMILAPKPE